MWNVAMESLLVHLKEQDYQAVAYVDDVTLLTLEKRAVRARALEIVSEWTNQARVALSYNKSKFILIKGKLSRRSPPNIRHEGKRIRAINELQYLGCQVIAKCF